MTQREAYLKIQQNVEEANRLLRESTELAAKYEVVFEFDFEDTTLIDPEQNWEESGSWYASY